MPWFLADRGGSGPDPSRLHGHSGGRVHPGRGMPGLATECENGCTI